MAARLLVGPADRPRGRVRHAEEQHLACSDEVVERLHQLRDGGGEVPPMHVELGEGTLGY